MTRSSRCRRITRASIRRSLPPTAQEPGSTKPDPVQAGKAAAATCGGCHGEGGVGKIPGMPSLAGLDPKYLVAAMKAYKAGQRKNDVMTPALARATDTEINNMALYYALQKPVRTENPASGDQAAGKAAAAACSGCHGELGVSENPAIPSLAGQDAQYFIVAMKDYKDGSRRDEPMKGLVAPLDETVIRNMAAWYAAQQPQPPKIRKPLTVRGVGAALRSLPRHRRQQHRSSHARAGGTARRLPAKGTARLQDRDAQEPADGGHVRRAERGRRRESRDLVRASEAARRRVRAVAREMSRDRRGRIAARLLSIRRSRKENDHGTETHAAVRRSHRPSRHRRGRLGGRRRPGGEGEVRELAPRATARMAKARRRARRSPR